MDTSKLPPEVQALVKSGVPLHKALAMAGLKKLAMVGLKKKK